MGAFKRAGSLLILLGVVFAALTGCAGAHNRSAAVLESPAVREAGPGDAEIARSVQAFLQSQRLALSEQPPEKVIPLLHSALRQFPAAAPLHYQLALQFARQQRVGAALQAVARATALDPDYIPAVLLHARLLVAAARPGPAVEMLTLLTRRHPTHEETATTLARVQIQQRRYAEAERTMRRLLAADPGSLTAYYYLGVIYGTHMKRPAEAVRMFRKLVQLQPQNGQMWKALAQAHLDQNQLSEALAVFLDMERQGLADITVQLRIGVLYYELGNHPEAIRRLTEVQQRNPKADKLRYYLGVIYEEAGNFARAMAQYRTVPASSRFYKDAILRMAVRYYRIGHLGEAIHVVEEGVRHQRRARAMYEYLAFLYQEKKDDAAAARVLRRAIRYHPRKVELYFALGVVYERMHKRQAAVRAMLEVIARQPDNARALNYVGFMYAEWGTHLDRAEALLTRAVRLAPRDGHILDSLAWVHYRRSDYARAFTLLTRADRLTPDEPAILRHIAQTLVKLGRIGEARAYLERGLRIAQKRDVVDDEEIHAIQRVLRELAA